MVTVENNLIGLEKNQNICTLTLNRPHKRNSLSPELVKLLLNTFEQLASDDSIRVVVLRGAGDKAFCSGYDIRSLPKIHRLISKSFPFTFHRGVFKRNRLSAWRFSSGVSKNCQSGRF